jgi:hypothetical protein
MKYINEECQITKEEAHDLLTLHKDHHLWNTPYKNWTAFDLEGLRGGVNKKSYKRHVRHQPVLVILNNGKEKKYASVKSVSNKFKMPQSLVSNILAGRKVTTKFLSIQKIL